MSATGTSTDAQSSPIVERHPVEDRLALDGSLTHRVRRSFLWAGGLRVTSQVVRFAGGIALARLLLPSDYGLLAIVASINGFGSMFTELGLASAIVHARELTDRLLSTAFWLNVVTGVVLTAVAMIAADPIAHFYGEPQLALLIRIASLSFTLSMGPIHFALLQRSHRFGRIGTTEVAGVVVSFAVSLSMAMTGYGAVSLVAGPVAGAVVRTGLFWTHVRWTPGERPGRDELRTLWQFGGGLTGFNIVNYWSRNIDNLLIGRYVSAVSLGFYGKAYSLMMLPLTELSNIVNRVFYPAFVEVRDDAERFRRAWLMTSHAALAVGLPFAAVASLTAEALVHTVLGPKWAGMVTVLALLSLSIPPQMIARTLGLVYQATGRTGLQFRLSIISTTITVGAVFIGLNWGIEGVAAALAIKNWIAVVIPLRPAMRLADVRARSVFHIAIRPAAVGGLVGVGAATPLMLNVADAASVTMLVVQLAGATFGFVAGILIFERELVKTIMMSAPSQDASRASRLKASKS